MASAIGQWALSFLAQPAEAGAGGLVEWMTDAEGEAIPAHGLPPGEIDRVWAHLGATAKSLSILARNLSASPEGPQAGIAGELLGRLARDLAGYLAGAPGPLAVYRVGASLVAANWGLRPGPGAPAPSPGMASEVERILAGGRPVPPPPPPAAPPAPQGAGGIGDFARASSVALLTLLLLLGATAALLPIPFRALASQAPAAGPGGGAATGLQAELYGLREGLLRKAQECPAQGGGALELAKEAPPEADPEEGPMAGLSVPKPPPDEGAAFEIPEGGDPNDLSFTKGCWVSDSGLVNTSTQLPLVGIYCLDGKGGGTVIFELFDSKGKKTGACEGTVRAKRDGRRVGMENSGPVCHDGSRFHPDSLTCELGEDGRTLCQTQNVHSRKNKAKPYYDSSFTYQGAYEGP
jgi:hypothetical protein